MTEESVTISAEQKKPIAAARTQHFVVHVDSGGGGDCHDSVFSSLQPIPAKRAENNNDAVIYNKNSIIKDQIKSTNKIVHCSSAYQLKAKQQQQQQQQQRDDDDDDGDDRNDERLLSASAGSATYAGDFSSNAALLLPTSSVCFCSNPACCVSLRNILDSFKNPLSEEQAWALIYQMVKLYHGDGSSKYLFADCDVPETIDNVNLHNDGSVHCNCCDERGGEHIHDHNQQLNGDNNSKIQFASPKKVLRKLGVIVYKALDYYLQEDEQCQMSQELEELITYMTAEDSYDDCIDEGIDEGYKRWDDESEDEKCDETKEFDFVLEACKNHVNSTVPEVHYRAVCRALVAETLELRLFLQKVLNDDTEALRIKADSQTSKQELATLGFNDWARFWVQVIDELRRGVRLKKNNYSRTPIEFELTPYEILMEDIRSKKYQLRKVMVNGDIPPRVKKDAHAMILEFIRSRPPLKKASERKLPPPLKRTPSPREQLMDSIRKGRPLKHIQPPSQTTRLLPPSATSSSSLTASHQQTVDTIRKEEKFEMQQSPRTKQRLIKVDFSLLQDDNIFDDSPSSGTSSMLNSSNATTSAYASQPKMPPYPIGGYLCNEKSNTIAPPTAIPNSIATRVLRRIKDTITEDEYHRFFDNALESYDLATQCESRRASMRRHTIVGCQSNLDETHSMPPSRPESRQSDIISIAVTDSTVAGAGSGDGTNSKLGYPLAVSNSKQQQAPKHIRKFQSAAYANTNEGASKKHQHQQLIHAKFKNTMEKNAQHNLPAPAHEPNFQQQQNSNDSSQMQSPGTSSTRSSSSIGATWTKSFLDEKHWTERGDDRLSLTLEEIVHIRSVMTKAELEGLPVGVRVKEDVEKRKVCFLCLRTRFSIFGPWGIQCKLCQRTVCSKCYTKMRIPTEHFRNVPVVLISPSLLSSPAGSSTPSPSHHAQHIHTKHSSSTGNILDEAFPKSLIERLLRSESERKNRHTVGSVPSSPKHQRSNMSTPGAVVPSVSAAGNQHQELFDSSASNDAVEATDGYDKENADIQHQHNGGGARPSGVPPATATNKQVSIMSRSMEGPRSLPVDSPARTHSNSSTLDRKSKFARAFTLSSSSHLSADQKENIRGELMAVCNDCEGLLLEIIRSSKQTRSSARNRALKNLTLDLSPVYK